MADQELVSEEENKEFVRMFVRPCIYGGYVEETDDGLQFIQAEIIIEGQLPVCINKKCNGAVTACGYKANREGECVVDK